MSSDKTIAGLRREVSIENLYKYFENHNSPTEEITDDEELMKYGISEESIKKQRNLIEHDTDAIVNIENRGDIIKSDKFGTVVINKNREIQTGSSAVYGFGFEGILNISDTSFMLCFEEACLNKEDLEEFFGDKFSGKVIRNKMWKVDDIQSANLGLDDVISFLENKKENNFNKLLNRFSNEGSGK